MKKLALTFAVLLIFGFTAMAQPQPGNNGNGTQTGGDPIGGGAPVGSGLAVLLAMGAAYGLKKTKILNRNQ